MTRHDRRHLTRRGFLKAAAGGAAVLGLPGLAAAQPEGAGKPRRPNILLIFDDQLRADALSCMGGRNIQTPHIDRLASEGLLFTNAVSSCPLCTPYRGMLMTGRYPTHSGIVINHLETNPDQRCLAHVFDDAGYRTAFIGKWHLAAGVLKNVGLRERPNPQKDYAPPLEADFIPPGPARLGFKHWAAYNFQANYRHALYFRDEKKMLYMDGYETDAEMDMAMRFMDDCQAAGANFLCVVAPHPPHPPFDVKHVPEGYLEKIPETIRLSANVPPGFAHRKNPLAARCYFAMIKNFDDNIGRILDYLDRTKLGDETIVILTADHGEMLGSHGLTNKLVPYAESVNIPLVMRWPGRIAPGRRTEALHTPFDHLTTLCGLAGLAAPATADGIDLSGEVTGKTPDTRDAVLMGNYSGHFDYFETGPKQPYPEWRAVKTRRHTYVKWLDGREMLFDNQADPGQMQNLAGDPASRDLLDKLKARLTELLAVAHDEFLPGTAYADWYDERRNLRRTALGPIAAAPPRA
ncbi:MAG: sulfatase [bacterium]|nr:sulfatase [bacterium]